MSTSLSSTITNLLFFIIPGIFAPYSAHVKQIRQSQFTINPNVVGQQRSQRDILELNIFECLFFAIIDEANPHASCAILFLKGIPLSYNFPASSSVLAGSEAAHENET